MKLTKIAKAIFTAGLLFTNIRSIFADIGLQRDANVLTPVFPDFQIKPLIALPDFNVLESTIDELTQSYATPANQTHPLAEWVGPLQDEEIISFNLFLNPKEIISYKELSSDALQAREQLKSIHAGQHAEDISLIEEHLESVGFKILDINFLTRSVAMEAPVSQIRDYLGANLEYFKLDNQLFRARSGSLKLPNELHAIVQSIAGLDERPILKRQTYPYSIAANSTAITPDKIAAFYGMDQTNGYLGEGVVVGVFEFGSAGYIKSDLQAAADEMQLDLPTFMDISVKGGVNDPTSPVTETTLDLQVLIASAPKATFVTYFAPDFYSNFADSLIFTLTNPIGINDKIYFVSVISMSYGGTESAFLAVDPRSIQTIETLLQLASTLNITLISGAGDTLVFDKDCHAEAHYPASSQYVTSVGGTSIENNMEMVWNDYIHYGWETGGGQSGLFAIPSFQAGLNFLMDPGNGTVIPLTMRGYPDVAGLASPFNPGYAIYKNSTKIGMGGNSAAVPLWAGYIARMESAIGHRIGQLNTKLYSFIGLNAFNPIIGNNSVPCLIIFNRTKISAPQGFVAATPWSPNTGLGSANGPILFKLIVDATHKEIEFANNRMTLFSKKASLESKPEERLQLRK